MPVESISLSARLIFALCAISLSAVILAMIRRNAIKEKYALLWLPLGSAFLVMSLYPDLLVAFSARVKLHYMTVVVLTVITVFTAILLYFTMRMSQMREDIKTLAQEIALARAREAAVRAGSAPAQGSSGDSPSGWIAAPKREVKDPARRA